MLIQITVEEFYLAAFKARSFRDLARELNISHETVRAYLRAMAPFLFKNWSAYKKFPKFLNKTFQTPPSTEKNIIYGKSASYIAHLIPEYENICCEIFINLCQERSSVLVNKSDALKYLSSKIKNLEGNSKNVSSCGKMYTPHSIQLSLLDAAIIFSEQYNHCTKKPRIDGCELSRLSHNLGKTITNSALQRCPSNRAEAAIRYWHEKSITRLKHTYITMFGACRTEDERVERAKVLQKQMGNLWCEEKFDYYHKTYPKISYAYLTLMFYLRPKTSLKNLDIGRLDHNKEHIDGNVAFQKKSANRKESRIRTSLSSSIDENIMYKNSILSSNPKLAFFKKLVSSMLKIREEIRFYPNMDLSIKLEKDYYIQLFFQASVFPKYNNEFSRYYDIYDPLTDSIPSINQEKEEDWSQIFAA